MKHNSTGEADGVIEMLPKEVYDIARRKLLAQTDIKQDSRENTKEEKILKKDSRKSSQTSDAFENNHISIPLFLGFEESVQDKTRTGAQSRQLPESDIQAENANSYISNIVNTVADAPGIIATALKQNPGEVLSKTALNTFFSTAYENAKEGDNILSGLTLDALMLAASPIKTVRLGFKSGQALGLPKKITNLGKPIDKSASMKENLKRNAAFESAVGAGDNLIYEAAADIIDEKEHDIDDYLLSGVIGAGTGAASGAVQVHERNKALNNYDRWSAPADHKKQKRSGDVQGDADANLESFTKFVNEEHPFNTTSMLHKKSSDRVSDADKALKDFEASAEANQPLDDSSLSDFKVILENKLYNDNSGNLTLTEASGVLQNFYDDATDMLLQNSPTLKRYMEMSSKELLGHPRAYLDNKEFVDLAMGQYNLTANDMNILKNFDKKGEGNPNYREYSDLFDKEMKGERGEQVKALNRLNEEHLNALNQEEMMENILRKQGDGGVMTDHLPFFDVNPEMNPTILGNLPLKLRQSGNLALNTAKDSSEVPEEDRTEIYNVIASYVADAKKLGLKSEGDIRNFVLSKLDGGNIPDMDFIGYSEQKKSDILPDGL